MGRTRREEEKPKWITGESWAWPFFPNVVFITQREYGRIRDERNKALRSWLPHAMMRTDSSSKPAVERAHHTNHSLLCSAINVLTLASFFTHAIKGKEKKKKPMPGVTWFSAGVNNCPRSLLQLLGAFLLRSHGARPELPQPC